MRKSFAVCALFALIVGARPARAQDGQPDEPSQTGVYWRNRPTIQLGEHVRLDVRFRMQLDWRTFDPEIGEDLFDRRALRGGLNGEIGDHLEFQIEHDLHSDGRWRDLYANWRTFRQAEIMAGRFKVPFGLEELTSFSDIDFAYRSLVSTTIPPARDKGVMVHGRFLRRGFTYQVGVFAADGDNGRLQEPQFVISGDIPGFGPSLAARVTATPFRPLGASFDTLRLGFAFGIVDVPEGLNSFRGETVYGTEEFFEPVYVNGRRTRLGTEVNYTPGPFGFAAEWMTAREERSGQGLGDVNLSDVITSGWYAKASWLVTGEDKDDFNNPRRPLFGGGFGAVELALRYETLGFASAEKIGPAFTNPRAEHILPNSDDVWTVGVNWFPVRWVRFTVNGIREEFEDAARTPTPGVTTFWSGVARLQLTF